ncbi:MAG: hypothetical protein ACRC7R_11175, partial [Sarcina sp.]
MATKIYNSHLTTIMNDCKEYFILDVYIALVHMSSQENSLYLIQIFDDTKSDLVKAIMKYIEVKRETIKNCLDKLIEIDILEYNQEYNAWILKGMENMHEKKTYHCEDINSSKKFTGYTKVRKLFLTNRFTTMKAREKRVIIYLAQLVDSKAGKHYKSFSMNLIKPNNYWLKILKTKDKYYAKYTIKNMLEKHKDLFIDKPLGERESAYSKGNGNSFKFNFHCYEIKKEPTDN